MKRLLAVVLLLLSPGLRATSGSIEDMGWLAGNWTGTGLDGQCEETWSPPRDGIMLGTFRLTRDGAPVFYEFLVLRVIDDRLTLRLKHFNPDMSGWEQPEKFVEFLHVRTTKDAVEFEGLTFRREGKDKMIIVLKLRGKDGTVREESFHLERSR